MAVLGPTFTLDALVECLVIGVGTMSGTGAPYLTLWNVNAQFNPNQENVHLSFLPLSHHSHNASKNWTQVSEIKEQNGNVATSPIISFNCVFSQNGCGVVWIVALCPNLPSASFWKITNLTNLLLAWFWLLSHLFPNIFQVCVNWKSCAALAACPCWPTTLCLWPSSLPASRWCWRWECHHKVHFLNNLDWPCCFCSVVVTREPGGPPHLAPEPLFQSDGGGGQQTQPRHPESENDHGAALLLSLASVMCYFYCDLYFCSYV